MLKRKENNFAFIDSQNLNLGIKNLGWSLDFKKFRVYLTEKYNVSRAYYFIGFIPENKNLYANLKKIGYHLVFKPIIFDKEGMAKGNIDADLVLMVMKEWSNYNKAVIVSSDGDFYSLVDHLFVSKKLEIVLNPHAKTCSSLLKRSSRGKLSHMNRLKEKLEYTKKRPVQGRNPKENA